MGKFAGGGIQDCWATSKTLLLHRQTKLKQPTNILK
jgi:hypothetical protein